MKILGIETSCDETSASVVENGTKLLSNVLSSSSEIHSKTGGIIPEQAAREQTKYIIPVIKEALLEASSDSSLTRSKKFLSVKWAQENIDAIAVTVGGPGLIGSLLVGVETAKALAFIWRKPIVPVVHMLAHLYANWLETSRYPEFPSIVLTVSGGHTDLLLMKKHGDFSWLGGTRDDTAGEAFDKIARSLGLSFPGGPEIQKLAVLGDPNKISFPKPLINSGDFDFSFSGLKTAVLREISKKSVGKTDIAASFQKAVCEVLAIKAVRAVKQFKAKSLLLAGGVAANQELRKILTHTSPVPTFTPPTNLCTDNGSFVASYAYFNFNPKPWNIIKAEPDIKTAVKKYA